jgi:subtilisin family serine protease
MKEHFEQRREVMKQRLLVIAVIMSMFLATRPAAAQNRVIVRDNLGLNGLNLTCLLVGCNVVKGLDGTQGQLFLIKSSNGLSLTTLLQKLLSLPGIVDVEPDQLLQVAQSQSPAAPAGLWDTTPVNYYGTVAWDGYVHQPATQIVNLETAQSALHVTGAGVVGVIDTGVDPNQPVLQRVLLPGYDFTRNQPGGSEMSDVNQSTMAVVNQSTMAVVNGQESAPAEVNQSTMAVVNQEAATDFSQPQYAAFGHGTMTSGIVHLVAPAAKIMPLKAFSAAGTGYLSDIINAVYWGTQHGANVFNMSFDFTTYSNEMAQAINYAASFGVVSVASVGNNGQKMMVYPAGLSNVMGVASVSDQGTLSTFSNFGAPPVWVAAPGEAIISTYPFATYAAGWGTSFSTPFVTGTVALMRSATSPLLQNINTALDQTLAAKAMSHADSMQGNACGYGILDIYQAVTAWEGLPL